MRISLFLALVAFVLFFCASVPLFSLFFSYVHVNFSYPKINVKFLIVPMTPIGSKLISLKVLFLQAQTIPNITIAGLFPMNGTVITTGPQRAAMALLATNFIAQDPTFNSTMDFNINFFDDGGQLQAAFKNALTAVQSDNYSAILGPDTSVQAELVSAIGGAFSVPLISYAASNPTLSNKATFPWFFRTCPSDALQTEVWLSLLQYYGWQQCALLASNDAYGTGVASAFLAVANAAGINVVVSYFDPTATSFTTHFQVISKAGTKIIFLAAVAGSGGRLCLKAAVQEGFMGKTTGYTWIISEASASFDLLLSASTENETSLTNQQFYFGLLGNLGTKPAGGSGHLWNSLVAAWASGSLNPVQFPGSPSTSIITSDVYVPYTIDAVYAFAYAMKFIIENGLDVSGQNVFNALANVTFIGVTGMVQFDKNFDREVPYIIMNIQDIGGNPTVMFQEVGAWTDPAGTATLAITGTIIWPDGTTNPPSDGIPRGNYYIAWLSPTSIVLSGFAVFAICLMLATALLVWYYSDTPVMRLASPYFLISTLVGLVIFFASVIAWFGLANTASCVLRIWLAFLGFVIALSGVIAKTYRVDVIFKRRKKIKKIVVTNVALIRYMVVMISPMVIFLAIWTGVDIPKPDFVLNSSLHLYVAFCHSKSQAWLIAALVYCAVMMLAMIILSFRTRRVPDGFNETWYIYISSYNTILMGVLGVILCFILYPNLLVVTIIVCVAELVGGLVMWGLLFGPKLYIALIAKGKNQPSLSSTRAKSELAPGRSDATVSTIKVTSDDDMSRSEQMEERTSDKANSPKNDFSNDKIKGKKDYSQTTNDTSSASSKKSNSNKSKSAPNSPKSSGGSTKPPSSPTGAKTKKPSTESTTSTRKPTKHAPKVTSAVPRPPKPRAYHTSSSSSSSPIASAVESESP